MCKYVKLPIKFEFAQEGMLLCKQLQQWRPCLIFCMCSTPLQHSQKLGKYIYKHNYNLLIRITIEFLASNFAVCVNFIHECWDIRTIYFLKYFMAILFILIVITRNLLRGIRRRNIFLIFRLVGDVWPGIWTTASRLISTSILVYLFVRFWRKYSN